MASNIDVSINSTNHRRRFSDMDEEPQEMLLCIEGYENMPLVTLEEAVKPLLHILPNIEEKMYVAQKNYPKGQTTLTEDESSAIMLYTMDWEPAEKTLYFVLNLTLRSRQADRKQKLGPWFLFLKLLITALSRLPSKPCVAYRGIKHDLSHRYKIGQKFVWWGFSSCTTSPDVLNQFCGQTDDRTLFTIECFTGKDIRDHSYFPSENEILLMAAREFEVVGCEQQALNKWMFRLKEIEPSSIHLRMVENHPYVNERLVKEIHALYSTWVINLSGKALEDRDMSSVVLHALKKKRCATLDLQNNHITSVGAKIIAQCLETNADIIDLKHLNLSGNFIGDEGICDLAKALGSSESTLELLDVGSRKVTDVGAGHLAKMLKCNKTLIKLHISMSMITDQGVKELAQALHSPTNTTLKLLDLRYADITDGCIDSLINMLQNNRSLNALWLTECPRLSEAASARLQQAVKEKQNFDLRLDHSSACVIA